MNAVNKRLDQLISLMLPAQPVSPDVRTADLRNEYDDLANQANSPFDLPSKLLGNSSVMHVLGLDAGFAQTLIRGERAAGSKCHDAGGTRMLIVHHRHAVRWVDQAYQRSQLILTSAPWLHSPRGFTSGILFFRRTFHKSTFGYSLARYIHLRNLAFPFLWLQSAI